MQHTIFDLLTLFIHVDEVEGLQRVDVIEILMYSVSESYCLGIVC